MASPPSTPADAPLDPQIEQQIDAQIQQLSRRCERILSVEELRLKLRHSKRTGLPLRIKMGMDPTAPDVTLGHAVPLGVIRHFQEWGHKAVLIIGDYTARVGDPTGRNSLRPQLSGEQIDAHAKTYVAQIGKILLTGPENLEVRWNSEWLGKMDLLAIIKLLGRKTVAQLLARDDFAKRYAENVDIRLHELAYPLLQGWDSVMIDADVEMGGSDQLFNNLVGREFQKEEGKASQVVIVTPLLVGTDGVKKMSKSVGNYVGVTDPPAGEKGMFGKIMSLPDGLMESWYTLLTDLPTEEFKRLIGSKPRDAKVRLAKHVISWLHSAEAADAAEREFFKATHGGIPDDVPEISTAELIKSIPEANVGRLWLTLNQLVRAAGLTGSTSEARQKIQAGAVKINGEKYTDPMTPIILANVSGMIIPSNYPTPAAVRAPFVLQLGSRKFVRVKV